MAYTKEWLPYVTILFTRLYTKSLQISCLLCFLQGFMLRVYRKVMLLTVDGMPVLRAGGAPQRQAELRRAPGTSL